MLVHLGWPSLCESFAEHLRTPVARASLAAELAHALGESDTPAPVPVLARSADLLQVATWLREQDGIEALLAVEATLQREAGAPGGLAEALARTGDVSEPALRASRGAPLVPAELLATLRQIQAASLCADLGYTIRGMDLAAESGMLAAKTVIEAKESGDFSRKTLSAYGDAIKNSFAFSCVKNAEKCRTAAEAADLNDAAAAFSGRK